MGIPCQGPGSAVPSERARCSASTRPSLLEGRRRNPGTPVVAGALAEHSGMEGESLDPATQTVPELSTVTVLRPSSPEPPRTEVQRVREAVGDRQARKPSTPFDAPTPGNPGPARPTTRSGLRRRPRSRTPNRSRGRRTSRRRPGGPDPRRRPRRRRCSPNRLRPLRARKEVVARGRSRSTITAPSFPRAKRAPFVVAGLPAEVGPGRQGPVRGTRCRRGRRPRPLRTSTARHSGTPGSSTRHVEPVARHLRRRFRPIAPSRRRWRSLRSGCTTQSRGPSRKAARPRRRSLRE
jgi:hypothetical protein